MPRRILSEWAKEEALSGIDRQMTSLMEEHPELDFDERAALLKQRNRVARMFRLPVRVTF